MQTQSRQELNRRFPSLLKDDAPGRDRLSLIVEMMREISQQQDPQEMFRTYSSRMKEVVPLDRRISLSRRDLEWPHYRITRSSVWQEEINPWKQPERLQLLSGGVLAELIYGDEPQIINDFQVDPDDPAAEHLQGIHSLMAIPLFDGGTSINMFVGGIEAPNAFRYEDLAEHVWMANLFGRATKSLLLAEQVNAAYAEIDRELKVVESLQRSLLPRELPEIPHLRLAVSYQTSRYAGGDYYDFFPLPDGRWGILIADVSGHGTPAAVVMAVAHTVAHTASDEAASPDRFLHRMNNYLSRHVTGEFGSFATAFYGVFNPESSTLLYSNAGHNPPRVKRCGKREMILLNQSRSLPLGISTDVEYSVAETLLLGRDRIVFYTDGITEAQSPSNELFGHERLDQTLGSCGSTAEDILTRVLEEVDAFTEGQPATDDRTILVAEVE